MNEFKSTFYTDAEVFDRVTLNPDTFCPQKPISIRVQVSFEAQHDGKSWTEDFVKKQEENLTEAILEDLRSKVLEKVREINPFSCHVFE